MDANNAAGHLRAEPIRHVTFDLNRAALHVGADVHAGPAPNRDAASGHAASNPLDSSRVTVDFESIARFAVNRKEVVDLALPLPQVNREPPDLFVGQLQCDVGRKHFGFEGD